MSTSNARFAAEIIQKHDDVTSIEVRSANTIVISSKKLPFIAAITISERRVSTDSVSTLLDAHSDHDFLCNIPRGCVWEGNAIDLISETGMGWGGVRNLMAAISDGDVRGAQPKEFRFPQRILSQHRNVRGLTRLFDKVYLIERNTGSSLQIILLDEYELTADHIRSAFEAYGPFDVIYNTNPYARPTQAAFEAAEALQVELFNTKQILARLYR